MKLYDDSGGMCCGSSGAFSLGALLSCMTKCHDLLNWRYISDNMRA